MSSLFKKTNHVVDSHVTVYSRDQHGLVVVFQQHVLVGVVHNGEDVGRHFLLPLTTVHLHDSVGIDGQSLVGVHSDTKQTGICLEWYITSSNSKTWPEN